LLYIQDFIRFHNLSTFQHEYSKKIPVQRMKKSEGGGLRPRKSILFVAALVFSTGLFISFNQFVLRTSSYHKQIPIIEEPEPTKFQVEQATIVMVQSIPLFEVPIANTNKEDTSLVVYDIEEEVQVDRAINIVVYDGIVWLVEGMPVPNCSIKCFFRRNGPVSPGRISK
jgi:hypothetical protein